MHKYTIGVDYGTSSVRAIVVDVANGEEVGSSVFAYPTGIDGVIVSNSDPHLARQNPSDYTMGFIASISGALAQAKKHSGFQVEDIVGIGIDTTGSTPIPVDKDGTPLALSPAFANNPNAQAWLWKDHTAWEEASSITEMAKAKGVPYLEKCGGTYSSEWFWSKVWHCLKVDPKVFHEAYSWTELCDYVPAWACGDTNPHTLKRSICAAGHKAMYHESWGGLPSKKFLSALNPELAALRDRLYAKAFASDVCAGRLCTKVAKEVGLPAGIPIAVGAFDCHHGAVAAGAKEGILVKVIGTSTCDIVVSPKETCAETIPGVCGLVPGSVVPGLIGIEAGQSAVGDIFNWFAQWFVSRQNCCLESGLSATATAGKVHEQLQEEAARLKAGQSGLLALDWNNGNRTILVDPRLTGLLLGQTLSTTPAEVYRALIEATAFGARAIKERIEEYGTPVKEVIACGGIAEKSPLLMQIYADVLGCPMGVSRSKETCALGAAIFGTVASGFYKSTEEAQQHMTGRPKVTYYPQKESSAVYNELYTLYKKIHDAFGGVVLQADLSMVMKELLTIAARER